MSMRTLEAAVVKELREVLRNPKLRNKDLLAWSTGDLTTDDAAELVLLLPGLVVNACVLKVHDKREATP